jgi:hypothetical protein
LEVLPFPYAPQVKVWDGSNLDRIDDRTDQHWRLDNITSLSLAAWMLRERGSLLYDQALRRSLEIEGQVWS